MHKIVVKEDENIARVQKPDKQRRNKLKRKSYSKKGKFFSQSMNQLEELKDQVESLIGYIDNANDGQNKPQKRSSDLHQIPNGSN